MKKIFQSLEPYFKEWNKNTGRIKEVTESDVLVNIAKSWGVGDMRFPLSACVDFKPKLDDRVFLCYSEEVNDKVLVKMGKGRQEWRAKNNVSK